MATRFIQILAPAAAIALTLGLFLHVRSKASQDDASGFHARVQEAVAALPGQIGDWTSTEQALPAAAGQLLRPNAEFGRHYRNGRTGLGATVLLVHCQDSRDMTGHWPPRCYKSHGWTQESAVSDVIHLWGQDVTFSVYQFSLPGLNRPVQRVIYNVFVLPKGGLVDDMNQVAKVGGDYRARPYGAAQVQVIFDAGVPETERLDALREVLEPMAPAIQAMQLKEGGSPPT